MVHLVSSVPLVPMPTPYLLHNLVTTVLTTPGVLQLPPSVLLVDQVKIRTRNDVRHYFTIFFLLFSYVFSLSYSDHQDLEQSILGLMTPLCVLWYVLCLQWN